MGGGWQMLLVRLDDVQLVPLFIFLTFEQPPAMEHVVYHIPAINKFESWSWQVDVRLVVWKENHYEAVTCAIIKQEV